MSSRDLMKYQKGTKEEVKAPFLVYDLQDRVSPDPGSYTTISVLNPAIRIERTAKKEDKDYFRISASFNLQAEIIGFDEEYVMQDSS